MHVQEDVPLFRVDPVIAGQYVAPNAENEITMECFDLPAWQEVVHHNESRIALKMLVWVSTQGSSPAKRGIVRDQRNVHRTRVRRLLLRRGAFSCVVWSCRQISFGSANVLRFAICHHTCVTAGPVMITPSTSGGIALLGTPDP